MITESQLKQLGVSDSNIKKYIKPLNETLIKYRILSPLQISHYLSQVLHESGRLVYSREIADGSAYEGRLDLGNTQKGDGTRFRGRGVIQITGRGNYNAYGKYVKQDLLKNPEHLEQPKLATDSSGWFWSVYCKRNGKSLNDMAELDWFFKITYHVNGSLRGLEERLHFLYKGYQIFGVLGYKTRMKLLYNYVEEVINKPKKDKGLETTLIKFIPNKNELDKLFDGLI